MASRFSILAIVLALLATAPCLGQAIVTGNAAGGDIVDNESTVSSFTLPTSGTITNSQVIESVRFHIDDLTHGWVGDLTAEVFHTGLNANGVVDTVSATLFDRVGQTTSDGDGDSSDVLGDYFFRDDALAVNTDPSRGVDWGNAAASLPNNAILPEGVYLASDSQDNIVELDRIFAGRSTDGIWTLVVSDGDDAVEGSFSAFRAELVVAAVPEPASGILLFGTSLFLLRRRRN